ncbi:MAG: DUF4959 domain-containing protein [Sphingobacteriaceae bacterium]|nr:MAG: DUF4959 domain-containing protein [Sphingobacteriaceae bacterium]
MKNIKLYCLQILCGLVLFGISACKENKGFNDPVSSDTSKPGIVTNVKVDNFNGGSYITYDLPNSENILYVLAKYSIRNGVARETKASYYSDTVTVIGFEKSQEYDVTLYTVSRANVMSDPVTVTVHPDTPVYLMVKPTVEVNTDFGGINIRALNPDKREIGIVTVLFNPATNQMDVEDQYFTKSDSINFSLRGYDTQERDFGVYVTDQYGNISDTLFTKLSPLFETMLDKSKFTTFRLGSDTEIGYGWETRYLWDGRTDNSSSGWHTNPGPPPPYVTTFGIGGSFKLSRFTLWERPANFAFNHGNPRNFSLWGSNLANPADAALPVSAPTGTVVGDWVCLQNYTYPNPPSGKPVGSTTAGDEEFVKAGVNFNVPLQAPAIRYIRFSVDRTWTGGNFAHAMELSFYGSPNN